MIRLNVSDGQFIRNTHGIDLTTIEEPRYLLGQTAATSMVELLNHQIVSENHEPLQITLQPKLIIRSTCSKVHNYMQ